MTMLARATNTGVALLTAMLVVALAASAAVGMAVRDQIQIQRAALLLEQDYARALLLGAETMARRLLESWDDYSEMPWEGCVSPAIPLFIDDFDMLARVENMHCRFNLNSLGRSEDPPIAAFADLLTRAGVAEEQSIPRWQGEQLAAAIADWLNPETDDPGYRLRDPPERSGNRPFILASEATRVLGMTSEIWAVVAPFLAARPGTDNVIDPEWAPEILLDALQGQEEAGSMRFFRLELIARMPQRDFFLCTLLDAPNGFVVVREFTSCEN